MGIHVLAELDRDALTATCRHCGPVSVLKKKAYQRPGKFAYYCIEAVRARNSADSRARHQAGTSYLARDIRHRLLASARTRASKRGLAFDLTLDDIAVPVVCPILGIPLQQNKGRPADSSPTVDRRDNTRGYTRDNIQVISWRANRIKSDATKAELLAIAASM